MAKSKKSKKTEAPSDEPVVSAEETLETIVEEPVAEEPAEEPVSELATESAEEPVTESAEELVTETVDEPVTEPAEEPVTESVEEPVTESVEEPVTEPVTEEPVSELATEEPVAEPVVEPVSEPVSEPAELAETMTENIVMEMQPVESCQVPKFIIIVPYRDRNAQKEQFEAQMKIVLEDIHPSHYRIVYVHQCDARSFNRGAMKNIGFQWVKSTYPLDYKRMTLVFQDVDTIPARKGLFDYETVPGTIKHFFGHMFALGGMVSINAADFEMLNGFPNYWAWGFEDNSLQNRAVAAKLNIDRSIFFPMMDANIIKLDDGNSRIVNRTEFDRYMNEFKYNNTNDGIKSLFNVNFQMDDVTGMLNVISFGTPIGENPETNQEHDIRRAKPFFVGRRGARMAMGF